MRGVMVPKSSLDGVRHVAARSLFRAAGWVLRCAIELHRRDLISHASLGTALAAVMWLERLAAPLTFRRKRGRNRA